MEVAYVVGGLIIVAVVVAAIVMMRTKQTRAQRLEQVKELHYLLDRVAEAAAKRKTQLYQSLDGKDGQILVTLKEAAQSAPVDISRELAEIDALWHDLSQQVSEFSDQSVQSTLQSSVVTSKAAQTAHKINHLVTLTKTKLTS
jgi:hypothetical protein